jgi:histidine triad (HIT) family protein
MSADCLFCRILTKAIPSTPVLETENAYAFQEINPQAPTHFLVIHKRHTDRFAQTEDNAIFADLFGAARDAAQKLNLSDYRVVVNNGAQAGQSVFHLHVHIIGGRTMQWPPG